MNRKRSKLAIKKKVIYAYFTEHVLLLWYK
jgi:hypothetical protein